MALSDLATALRQVGGDPAKAAQLARAAAAAVVATDPPYHAFIGVDPAIPEPLAERRFRRTPGLRVLDQGQYRPRRVPDDLRFGDAGRCAAGHGRLLDRQSLKRAGAVCIGKNNMHEFALGATGANDRSAPPLNPWDTSAMSAARAAASPAPSPCARCTSRSAPTAAVRCGCRRRSPASSASSQPPASCRWTASPAPSWTIDCLGLFTRDRRRPAHGLAGDRRGRAGPQPGRPRIAYLSDDGWGASTRVWERYRGTREVARRGPGPRAGLAPWLRACPYICISIVYPEVASWHHELLREKPNSTTSTSAP